MTFHLSKGKPIVSFPTFANCLAQDIVAYAHRLQEESFHDPRRHEIMKYKETIVEGQLQQAAA